MKSQYKEESVMAKKIYKGVQELIRTELRFWK